MAKDAKFLNKKHIVIFSHGMGVRKDARGLFTEISEFLSKYSMQSVLFDYCEINPNTNEVIVESFGEQAKILQKIIDKTNKDYPNCTIDIIAHSQGAVMTSLIEPTNISKIILLAPFFHTKAEDIVRRHNKNNSSSLDFSKTSKRKRSDGTITVIPPQYWAERFTTPIELLYNKLAAKVDLTIINASEDEIMNITNLTNIYNTSIINIKSNHDFTGEVRKDLKILLAKILIKN